MPELKARKKSARELQKAIVRFLKGCIRSVYTPSQFFIKAGYQHRTHVEAHDDRGYKEEFQKEVYQKAAVLMEEFQLNTVIDIGCGSGYKLHKYLGHFQTLGVDTAPVIAQAIQDYPMHKWADVSTFNPDLHEADLIICADVIEHVDNPDNLLKIISSIKNWKYLIISTPERNQKRGVYHFGPPPNTSHFREWNRKEFRKLLSKFFVVTSHEMVNREQATQMVICRKR